MSQLWLLLKNPELREILQFPSSMIPSGQFRNFIFCLLFIPFSWSTFPGQPQMLIDWVESHALNQLLFATLHACQHKEECWKSVTCHVLFPWIAVDQKTNSRICRNLFGYASTEFKIHRLPLSNTIAAVSFVVPLWDRSSANDQMLCMCEYIEIDFCPRNSSLLSSFKSLK